jgi:alpha/beta superfamily hydrolase
MTKISNNKPIYDLEEGSQRKRLLAQVNNLKDARDAQNLIQEANDLKNSVNGYKRDLYNNLCVFVAELPGEEEMVEKIDFMSKDLKLEGLLERNSADNGVVITHPHPLYGGDMYNYVVETIANAYGKNGYTTLKFNFRGAGMSQGSFDNGIGEQSDVFAALSYLMDLGIKKVDLAGYSFGAWINALTAQEDPATQHVQHLVMVSPPVGFVDFDSVKRIDCLKLVVTGSMDDIAPAGAIRNVLSKWNPDARLDVIDGADHFYMGYTDELESILMASL